MAKRLGMVSAAVATLLVASATFGFGAARAASSHAAVTITSNDDFTTCGCVSAGNGTPSSPYVIGPYQVGVKSPGGYAVKIDNFAHGVIASFTISGISLGYNEPILRTR
jgi:hypothetical protein